MLLQLPLFLRTFLPLRFLRISRFFRARYLRLLGSIPSRLLPLLVEIAMWIAVTADKKGKEVQGSEGSARKCREQHL
jgi:hypothetical protein